MPVDGSEAQSRNGRQPSSHTRPANWTARQRALNLRDQMAHITYGGLASTSTIDHYHLRHVRRGAVRQCQPVVARGGLGRRSIGSSLSADNDGPDGIPLGTRNQRRSACPARPGFAARLAGQSGTPRPRAAREHVSPSTDLVPANAAAVTSQLRSSVASSAYWGRFRLIGCVVTRPL